MKPISDKKTQMQNINRIWLGQKLICKAYVGHMFIKVLVTAFFSLNIKNLNHFYILNKNYVRLTWKILLKINFYKYI